MSTLETKSITADELLRMPDDGFRYELVKGELLRMSPTGTKHGEVTMNLAAPLHHYVKLHKLGKVYAAETGFKLESDPDTVRAPDIAFVRAERIQSRRSVHGYGDHAPDLAVEVLSPGNTKREIAEKINEYFAAGARMVWVVNPKLRTVTVHRSLSDVSILTESDTLHGGDVMPGFQLGIAEIFAE